MFYECSGCQAVMAFAGRPPHVCPECGLAGILFCLLDDQDLADLMSREVDFTVSLDPAARDDGDGLSEAPAMG
ncbi:MAG TPA: hypothetical protein VFB81_23380 [Myxococcales bacterium]|nr:hypothetical protein [Myxococcales bacterium]